MSSTELRIWRIYMLRIHIWRIHMLRIHIALSDTSNIFQFSGVSHGAAWTTARSPQIIRKRKLFSFFLFSRALSAGVHYFFCLPTQNLHVQSFLSLFLCTCNHFSLSLSCLLFTTTVFESVIWLFLLLTRTVFASVSWLSFLFPRPFVARIHCCHFLWFAYPHIICKSHPHSRASALKEGTKFLLFFTPTHSTSAHCCDCCPFRVVCLPV